jgi:glutathione S-transferase
MTQPTSTAPAPAAPSDLRRKPKLTYFRYPGRAEPSRLAFVIGGIDFEDERLDQAKFQERKQAGDFPIGSIPVLEINGNMYCQSNAILRYIGKMAGLYPKNVVDALKVDQVLATCEDIFTIVSPALRITDKDQRMAAGKDLYQNVLPRFVQALNNWCEGGYVVGNQITIGDLAIHNITNFLAGGRIDLIPPEFFKEAAPNCLVCQANVNAHPKVKAYNDAKPPPRKTA